MESIFIVTPNQQAYSETFIHNHIQYLPGDKYIMYLQEGRDAHWEDGKSVLKKALINRIGRWIERKYYKTTIRKQEIACLVDKAAKNQSCILAEYGPIGSMLTDACKKRKVPLIVHFHGYDAYQYNFIHAYKGAYQKMFHYAKALIAVSKDMQDQLYKLGAPKQKVKLIPYGIDLNSFTVKIDDRKINFIMVGRLVEKKAPFLSILAFKKVTEQAINSESKLIIIGVGALEFVCKQLVKSLSIEDKVVFKGMLANDEVARLMNESFCFLQHSLTPDNGDSEGTPLAVLEASACGLPVISTKHGGIKDAVIHGETGYLVEEGDIEGMAQYMYELLSDTQLAYTMGLKGRAWIEKNHDLSQRIRELWQVLQS